MIRTEVVILTSIPAKAYRQKLTSGGAGIVIIREGTSQPGIASISKTSGEAILSKNTPKRPFPLKAFREAIELTAGLPYIKRGKPTAEEAAAPEESAPKTEEEVKEEAAFEVIIDSEDYQKILDRYTDKNGKFSYELFNKDLIKFAHSSSKVRAMAEQKVSEEEIRLYAAGTKFRSITGNKDLTDEQVLRISELLDEIEPKGLFKEFNSEIRKMLK